jgi:hypothetical protein
VRTGRALFVVGATTVAFVTCAIGVAYAWATYGMYIGSRHDTMIADFISDDRRHSSEQVPYILCKYLTWRGTKSRAMLSGRTCPLFDSKPDD